MQFVPLLADWDQWIKLIIGAVVGVIWLFNKLYGADAARKRMAQQRPRPAPAPTQPQPQPVARERQRVEDEVAEFLRRATQGKESRSAPPAPPKPARKAPAEPAPVRRLAPKRDESAPLYDNEPAAPRRPSVAPKLGEKPLGAGKRFDVPRPSEIEQADEAMELQVHQALDHQIGNLASTAPMATSDQTPIEDEDRARSIGELLRDPRSIRDGIVVSEILRRPTERW